MFGGMYGTFRDACPDFWGRQILAEDLRKHYTALSASDLLTCTVIDRIGNLEFGSGDASPPEWKPTTDDLQLLSNAVDWFEKNMEEMDRREQHFIRLLAPGSSLGGARPKTFVYDEQAAWIAKFPSKNDTWSNARLEGAVMSLAAKVGINAACVRLEEVVGKDILLVKRFDRVKEKDGFSRLGYMSAMTLLRTEGGEPGKHGYDDIAAAMRKLGLPAADSRELFLRMLLNVAMRNTDDHLRNHGFIRTQNGWRLSPAFDVVTTRIEPSSTCFHALSVGMMGAKSSMANALSLSAKFGLEKADAEKLAGHVQEAIIAYWSQICRDWGIEGLGKKIYPGA
jgi:serine/threonine-protein kinase HipA